MNAAESSHAAAPRRTLFTTLIGISAIVLGGLGSLFSAFALLMAIGKPYANSNADAAGIFLIFILPPATLLSGIGLLFRFRWARWCLILMMSGLVAAGVKGLFPKTIHTSAITMADGSEVPMTWEHRPNRIFPAGCVVVGALVLLGMFSAPVRREFQARGKHRPPSLYAAKQDESEGWRVGHSGRDMMFYEEKHGRKWLRLEIQGEMLMGAAHHVIYFRGEGGWEGYPEWARGRREEIIARIKSRFRPPEYEYQVDDRPASSFPDAAIAARAPVAKDGSILLPVAALLLIAAGAFWLAFDGVRDGEVRSVAKNRHSRVFTRAADPGLFWATVSIIGAVGAGCVGFAGWIVVASARGGK